MGDPFLLMKWCAVPIITSISSGSELHGTDSSSCNIPKLFSVTPSALILLRKGSKDLSFIHILASPSVALVGHFYHKWEVFERKSIIEESFYAHIDKLDSVLPVKHHETVEQRFNGVNQRWVATKQNRGPVSNLAEPSGFTLLNIGSVSTHDEMPAEVSCSQRRFSSIVQDVNCGASVPAI